MTISDSQKAWGYVQKKKTEQGYIHLYNYFLEISRTEKFSKSIRSLRKKYKIPPEGFSKIDHNDFLRWSEKHNETFSKKIFNDVYKLCEGFFLPKEWWKAVMEALFHDSEDITDLGFGSVPGLCIVSTKEGKRNKSYPVSLEISPYASKRDIINFIEITYSNEIEPKQKRYRKEASRIGKVKSKNIDTQRRNDFIYKNRHLSLVEIRKLLAKKKIFMDDGHIAKIRSLEEKRRKDV